MLENPVDFGLAASALTFSVTVSAKNGNGTAPRPEDFTFYLMDKADHLYNTRYTPCPDVETDPGYDEPMPCPDWLIYTDFRPEFLYQDLRIVFYYRPAQTFNVIVLRN